jgi:ATP-dependent DNA helicase PIF1
MPKATGTPPIEINEEFQKALHIMEDSSKNVFITGRAGTGKSTLLSYFRLITKKKVAVLAPTGVAALNVQGQTIHSFFKFKPNITASMIKRLRAANEGETIYQRLDAIVIDEISMVRADLLDCVDRFLRLNGPRLDQPFGGIQMIFIGDLYQLPPVVTGAEKEGLLVMYETPYFYSARVFSQLDMEFVELEKIYRQHDPEFINLLNSIRNRSIEEKGIATLRQRYQPDFTPTPGEFFVYLTTTNAMASDINKFQLKKLRGQPRIFVGTREGDFGDEYLPTAVELQVKTGSQIMMLNNDTDNRWVNGTIGEITGFGREAGGESTIIAELAGGEEVEITPYTWQIYRYKVEGGSLESEVVGTFTQYPLMLAWAITIHKSQGKTFDKVIIDIGRGTFAHGQMYVALSRCTTFEGIILKRPVLKQHIWTDFKVVDFLTKYQYSKSEQRLAAGDKIDIIKRAIKNHTNLKIVYLKPSDEKSRRTILPRLVGEMEYKGKTYLGVRAFCLTRNAERIFIVDRILEIEDET